VLHRIRETRSGKLYDSQFGTRQTGEGQYADTVAAMFEAVTRKLGYGDWPDDDGRATFRRPPPRGGQMSLF